MTGIYKITNTINGKIYVGQAVDIKRRWQEHGSHSFSPTHTSYNHTIHRVLGNTELKTSLLRFQKSVLKRF